MRTIFKFQRKQFIAKFGLVLIPIIFYSSTSAQTFTGQPFEEAEALFRQNPAWLGSDGANSTPLGNGRIFWSFEDTFVDTSESPSRQQATMVRNSIAIQTGNDPLTAKMDFYWGRNQKGLPASFFLEEGDAWYWTGGAILLDEGPLVIFLYRMESAPGVGLGFRNSGYAVAIITNPAQPPSEWVPVIIKGRQSEFDAVPATAVVRDGDYIVGLAIKQEGAHSGALVRYLASSMADGYINNPQWWAGASLGWVGEQELGPAGPTFVIEDAGSENSLHWDQQSQSFIHIATYGFGAVTIGMRTAPSLTGPWGDPVEVYRPPESDSPRPFVYGAIAHPELQGPNPGDLIVTYATNSFEFEDMFTEYGSKNLYWPRVISIDISQKP